jgi:hypothetical protein
MTDTVIENEYNEALSKCIGINKDDLRTCPAIILSDLLAGLLIFTTHEVKNRVGAECIKELTAELIDAKWEEYKAVIKSDPTIDFLLIPTRQVDEAFRYSIDDCCIRSFVMADPTIKIRQECHEEAMRFVRIVRFLKDRLSGEVETIKDVELFAEKLNEYDSYLSRVMIPQYGKTDYFVPNCAGNAERLNVMHNYINRYLSEIDLLYGKILQGESLYIQKDSWKNGLY